MDLKPCFLFLEDYKFQKIFYYLYSITFLSSLLLAIYHFGIENNFWSAFTSCEINDSYIKDKSNLKEYLLEKEFVSCSKVNFSLLGISLVGYNIIISLFLLILSLLKLRKN